MTTFPVIASIVSEKDLGKFIIEKYNLNDSFECKLYRTGLNHTYFISNATEKYVVRLYCHNWRSKNEIIEELDLLKVLKDDNLPISYPISDKNEELIQEINAPEGIRYVVLFSFAKGEKVRFITNENCFTVGSIMAKIHNVTANKKINRVNYSSDILLEQSYNYLKLFFSEELNEMKFLKETGLEIAKVFAENSLSENQKGIVHLDIWYDNFSINKENEITIFDFDNCGNGSLVLDIGYFCKQLFFIEQDKNQYESKAKSFIDGYQQFRPLSEQEIKLIPEAGASIFMFYLGVQAQRFDWSNIFLTENYLKMFVGRIKNWLDYYKNNKINCDQYSSAIFSKSKTTPNNMQDIIKKFKFKDNAIVINASANLEIQFVELGFKTAFDKDLKSGNTLIFINNNEEYLDFLNNQLDNIEPDSVLWFAYPKGTSKVKTDINRDTIRVTGEEFNITTVSAISIDDTWSGLRFRPIDRVGKK